MFGSSGGVGSIQLITADESPEGELHRFRTEAGIRGGSLILFEDLIGGGGSGPPTIVVVPYFSTDFRAVRAGLIITRTWDDTDIVGRCVFSSVRLPGDDGIDAGKTGDLTSDTSALLDDVWEGAFRAANKIAPRGAPVPGP
jgi:hypothetical protein